MEVLIKSESNISLKAYIGNIMIIFYYYYYYLLFLRLSNFLNKASLFIFEEKNFEEKN